MIFKRLRVAIAIIALALILNVNYVSAKECRVKVLSTSSNNCTCEAYNQDGKKLYIGDMQDPKVIAQAGNAVAGCEIICGKLLPTC